MVTKNQQSAHSDIRIAIDIGSTIIKVAHLGTNDNLLSQEFYPRDFVAGIATQVESILDELDIKFHESEILVCSSANGGLRIGIVFLTKFFSGNILRNQVLSAGANPIFASNIDEDKENLNTVDILLVGGGIDCEDSPILEKNIRNFKPSNYHFDSLFYAGNKYLSDLFVDLFPSTTVIPNPLGDTLLKNPSSVFEALRRAYLDDLVYKEGVSELRNNLSMGIRPTPEVVNNAFQRIVFNHSSIKSAGACVLLDIGGATTDIHYTVEIIREDSNNKPTAGTSIARYVFTDLGIVLSSDSTLLQMRTHPRIYDFLNLVLKENVRDTYQLLREGEYSPSQNILSYACLFLSLDRFSKGKGPGLPQADLSMIAQVILTGGAIHNMDKDVVSRLVNLSFSDRNISPRIFIDKNYQVWIDGITWIDAKQI